MSDQDAIERLGKAVFEIIAELQDAVRTLHQRTKRAVDLEQLNTAGERARAERAENALQAAGVKPGEPIEWTGPAVAARVVSDERRTDLRVMVGHDGVATTVFGSFGEARSAAVVAFQSHAALVDDRRDVRVELWLDLKPGGALDELADVVGKLIQARDAAAVSAQASTASVEVEVRPIAGSAT